MSEDNYSAMSSTRVNFSLPDELIQKLEKKAKDLDRAKSWIVKKALEKYL